MLTAHIPKSRGYLGEREKDENNRCEDLFHGSKKANVDVCQDRDQ